MSDEKKETRDRVRELVRQVLEAVPEEPETQGHVPEHVVVNSLQDKVGREFDRDESAKSLITEDDLRGLVPGSKLRVADGVRFTPLARDFIDEKNIELIKKVSRKGELTPKVVPAKHPTPRSPPVSGVRRLCRLNAQRHCRTQRSGRGQLPSPRSPVLGAGR